MGKFLKICLIIGVICIAIGVIASAAGVTMGGLPLLKEQILKGDWSFDSEDIPDFEEWFDADGVLDMNVEPFFELEEQDFFDSKEEINESSERQEYAFQTDGITGINLKCAGVTADFMVHNGTDILIYTTKTGKYQNYIRDQELSIVVTGQNEKNLSAGAVEILIPEALCEEAQLDLDIEAAASVIKLGALTLDEVELEVNAGVVNWEGLEVGDLSMNMATGTVNGVDTHILRKTDIEMHAGSVELSGGLGTETELEIMAGKIALTLENKISDFNYDVSCAGGSVTIGEEQIQGLGKDMKQNNNASNQMDIECSAGAVNIQFD